MDINRVSYFLEGAFNQEVLIRGRHDSLYGFVVLGEEKYPHETEKSQVLDLLNDTIFRELWDINQANHYYNKDRIDIPLSETFIDFNFWRQNQSLRSIGDEYSLDLKGFDVFSSKNELIDCVLKGNHPLNRLYLFRYTMNTSGGTDHEGIIFSFTENLKSVLSTGHTRHSNL